jgi:magnesium transporter
MFTYLEHDVKKKLINDLSGEQLGNLLEFIYNDDIVDFIQEMPSNLVRKILKSAHKETRNEVNLLLNYAPNSAGSIMTTEYIELKSFDSVSEAINKIRKFGREAETISYLYIVDDKRLLVGSLKLKELLIADEKEVVNDIMDTNFVSVTTHDDQEEVAQVFKKYDMSTLPVTTDDGRLVGIITFDDIIDVIEEETTEDIHKMAGVAALDEQYIKTSNVTLARKRLTWLLFLMVSATLTGLIINGYEGLLTHLPVLSIFVPMLMGTAGNAGSQVSVLIIRALALEEISESDYFIVVRKELGVALIVGGVLSVIAFIWIMFQFLTGMISSSWANTFEREVLVAFVVALSLYITVLFSKTIGATLPILAKKLNIDPALMASALVTTIADSLAIIIYFVLALSILGNFF